VNYDPINRTEAIELIRSLSITIGGKEIFHPEAKKSVIEALDTLPDLAAVPVAHIKYSDALEWYKGDDIRTLEKLTRGVKIPSMNNKGIQSPDVLATDGFQYFRAHYRYDLRAWVNVDTCDIGETVTYWTLLPNLQKD
jgi:hypothetical protein